MTEQTKEETHVKQKTQRIPDFKNQSSDTNWWKPDLCIQFLTSTNWGTYLRLFEIAENKNEKRKIREEDGKNNVTLEDW